MEKTILIIDDDMVLQELLQEYLKEHLLYTVSALTGKEALKIIQEAGEKSFDLAVLDIMLPDMDGFETLRHIRAISSIPVIMLTARSDETDRIIGLEMGADDYMHKPFNPRELLARIKAVLRRGAVPSPPGRPDRKGRYQAGPFLIDTDLCNVYKHGRQIPLSAVEFDILKELALSPGRPFSREHLLNITRGRDFEAFDRSIDVHISRIRKKIEQNPTRPEYIRTIWGKGYAWGDDKGSH